MKLNLEQIQKITTGAARIREEKGLFYFNRFTAEQEELYRITDQGFYNVSFSTAGVKFFFKTDSKNLFLKLKTSVTGTRRYFSVDVFVNDCPIGYIDNFSDTQLAQDYTKQEFLLGDFSGNFVLGDGVKTVCVHLPWSVKTIIEEISVDDNSFIEGIKPKRKLIAYGDSITQGYDALRPSNRYTARLADSLEAEEFNKAIGGAKFFPELAQLKDSFIPDYITVAYGTNDWFRLDRDTFKSNCKSFYTNISQNYQDSKIFAITPIWRKDMNKPREYGEFKQVEQDIRSAVMDIENVTVVSGFDFVPEDEKYFADLRLHPNDDGFECYEKNLYEKIKKYI